MSFASSLSSRLTTALLVSVLGICASQARDVSLLPSSTDDLTVFNRKATSEANGVVHLDAGRNAGIAWIPGVAFSQGELSLEVRGLDVQQKSFVGIAFHGLEDGTYDCVYVRPFNFNSPDEVRRARSVQYISIPNFDWDVLRERFPGQYESAVKPPPAAEAWVHLKLVLKGRQLSVFVDHAKTPALTVGLLNERLKGRVGLWVGNNSEGWFRNLVMNAQDSK